MFYNFAENLYIGQSFSFFCSFFGRIEETIYCFRDFLTIELFGQENKTSNSYIQSRRAFKSKTPLHFVLKSKIHANAWLINLTGFLRLTIFSTSMSLAFLSVWMIMSSTIWVCIRIKEKKREKHFWDLKFKKWHKISQWGENHLWRIKH